MTRWRPMIERFWANVRPEVDGCWLWAGRLNNHGYGRIRDTRISDNVGAHRLSYEIAYGPVPDGMCVLHRCDVRACVRPDHLFLGTRTDNYADCVSKGRHLLNRRKGEGHQRAKLTNAQVAEIRERRGRGETAISIARDFGVAIPTVYGIATRRTWRHVP